MAVFVGVCVLPVIYMLVVSFLDAEGNFTIANYSRLLAEARQRNLLLNSTLLGAGAAMLASLIGAPLGLLLARADVPAKRLFRLALVVPLVIPPYILALAWIYLGGSAGLIAQAFGQDLLSDYTYSLPGAIVVLGIAFYPLSMLATEAAARRVDARLEEAALMVARPRRVLLRITLPLIAPHVAAAALIIFVLALAEFGVPGLLRVNVFTTEVFTAFAALYDFGAATALAVPLLLVTLIIGFLVKLITGERLLATSRSSRLGLPLKLGRWRAAVVLGLFLLLASCVLSPLSVLAIEAGQVGRIIAAASGAGVSVGNSLVLSIVGATLIVTVAVFLGYGRARSRTKLRGAVDLAFIVLFAVPSTVVGVGLIGLWNRPGWLAAVYTSPAIIIIGYLSRFLPVAALILAASVRQISISFEEAAEVAGASWPRVFARIVFPQMRTGLIAAWVVSFIFASGELGATILLAPPGESTLPIRVYTIIANTPSSDVAALALMQAGIILLPLALVGVFAGNKGDNR
ncbi:MAG TPA: iron ABC transporter permease [Blastocatellia bacterium]|nr:iron ABC transporter permease [Blastocatellia bacterium]